MKYSELIESVQTKLPELQRKAIEAAAQVDDEKFNAPFGSEWSIAMVFQHLILANAPYLEKIETAISIGPKSEDFEVKHTWFGGMIAKMAGPGGNAPAPKQLVPETKTYSKEIIDVWVNQNDRILEHCLEAKGIDLNATRFKNPFIKIFTMNLADALAIALSHTDRHVRQIAERASVNE